MLRGLGPLYFRNIERDKTLVLQQGKSYDDSMCLSQSSIHEIKWWLFNLDKMNGRKIQPDPVLAVLETDASLVGWGTKYNNNFTQGLWSKLESS